MALLLPFFLSKISQRLFAPGGILDSQTTDTQWEHNLVHSDADSYPAGMNSDLHLMYHRITKCRYCLDYSISQLNFLELQRRNSEPASTLTTQSPSPIANLSLPVPKPLPMASLTEKVLHVIEHHTKEVEEDIRRWAERQIHAEVEALQARVDLLCKKLSHERRWIHTLEESL